MAKYKKLADIFVKKIIKGHYPINSPLPSLRQLCKLEKISMTTALACYRYLEQLGYVCASEKRGYFVSQPRVDEHIEFPNFDASISEIMIHSKHHVEQKSEFYRAELDPELSDTKLLSIRHSAP